MMDKSWINKPRNTKDYLDGVANFVKLANEKASINGKIYCPCRKCFNRSLFVPEIVEEHLVWNGFLLGYTEWVLHGESLAGVSYEAHHSQDNQSNLGSTNVLDPIGQDATREMVQDIFGFNFANLEQSSDDDDIENLGESSERQQANSAFDRSMPSLDKDTTWYGNLLQDCDKEFYPGCKNYSKITRWFGLCHPANGIFLGLVFADVNAIKENSAKLGAGEDLYALFARVLTMRPWNRVIDPSVDHLVLEGDEGDRSELQEVMIFPVGASNFEEAMQMGLRSIIT